MDTLASRTKDARIAPVKQQAEARKEAQQARAALTEEIALLQADGTGRTGQRE